jgi:hypothetical protein
LARWLLAILVGALPEHHPFALTLSKGERRTRFASVHVRRSWFEHRGVPAGGSAREARPREAKRRGAEHTSRFVHPE